jgi:hypothetical protein
MNLDISGMNVDGDVQSGGTVQFRTNGSNAYYDVAYPNSIREIQLLPFPSSHNMYSPSNLNVDSGSVTINQSYRFSSITVGQNGTLHIVTAGNVIQIVVDNLYIDNNLNINASGGGRVEIFVNTLMRVTTKGLINNTYPKNLFIYLKDNSSFEIQANMELNGYIIGPYATVQVQSAHSTTNGAIIANVVTKNAAGNGPNGVVNYVPLQSGVDYGDNILEYRIIRWQK